MTKPRISIALACYNGSRFLQEQIDSLIKQSIVPYEIIICDDQSSDDTEKLIKSLIARNDITIKFFINETRLGPVKNFEKAINLCSGDYVALCDQDDVWHPNKLEEYLRAMGSIEHHSSIPCLVFSDSELVDENLNSLNITLWNNLNVDIFKQTFNKELYFNPVNGCTMMFNQSLKFYLKEIPNEAIMHDVWITLIAYGMGRVGILNQSTMQYRRHRSNFTVNQRITIWNRLASLIRELINERKSYLQPEIKQAEKFYHLYKPHLNENNLNDLTKIISLRKSSFIKRRLARFIAHHL